MRVCVCGSGEKTRARGAFLKERLPSVLSKREQQHLYRFSSVSACACVSVCCSCVRLQCIVCVSPSMSYILPSALRNGLLLLSALVGVCVFLRVFFSASFSSSLVLERSNGAVVGLRCELCFAALRFSSSFAALHRGRSRLSMPVPALARFLPSSQFDACILLFVAKYERT